MFELVACCFGEVLKPNWANLSEESDQLADCYYPGYHPGTVGHERLQEEMEEEEVARHCFPDWCQVMAIAGESQHAMTTKEEERTWAH